MADALTVPPSTPSCWTLYVTAQPGGGETVPHDRSIVELDVAVAVRPAGMPGMAAHGSPGVVTVTGVLGTDTLPALSRARTAY